MSESSRKLLIALVLGVAAIIVALASARQALLTAEREAAANAPVQRAAPANANYAPAPR